MNVETNELDLVQRLEGTNRSFMKNLAQRFNGQVSVAMPLIKTYISQLRQVYFDSTTAPTLKDAVGDILQGLYHRVGREGREDLLESGLLGY
jgi:hypothetical protein